MSRLVVKASSTEEWLTLVSEAKVAAACRLDEDMESYLVFQLMRFTEKPEIAASVMVLDYLRSMQLSGHLAQDQLREVGDKCLLYSGLFPERAARRRVKVSYFVDLGRSAYQHLSGRLGHDAATLYQRLAYTFVGLMDVLQTMRELGQQQARPDPLRAYELWRDTGSAHRHRRRRTAAPLIPCPSRHFPQGAFLLSSPPLSARLVIANSDEFSPQSGGIDLRRPRLHAGGAADAGAGHPRGGD